MYVRQERVIFDNKKDVLYKKFKKTFQLYAFYFGVSTILKLRFSNTYLSKTDGFMIMKKKVRRIYEYVLVLIKTNNNTN